MNILFICKHNRFRSKVAETIFNFLNKNENYKAESAGIILDNSRPYIGNKVVEIMNEKGYNIYRKNPRKLRKEMIDASDLIVIVANNVKNKFHKKTIQWGVPDCGGLECEKIEWIISDIENRIKELIKNLNILIS